LSSFFAVVGGDDESGQVEVDASSLLFGKMASKSAVPIVTSAATNTTSTATAVTTTPATTTSSSSSATTSLRSSTNDDVATEDARLFVQKMRLSEVTFVLCARGFTIAIPNEWRVCIKALQTNAEVTDWTRMTKTIVYHFVKKIAKSLVLKNGAKTIVGSLTGKSFKAHGSTAALLTAKTEEESAALLFGRK
jgi:hypothetical protein